MRDVGRLVTCDVERFEAYGREHGLAALLDHLGLDGFANEVVVKDAEILRLVGWLERIYQQGRGPHVELARRALNGDPYA